MAAATRSIRVRFDGDMKGLNRAARAATRAVDGWSEGVRQSAKKATSALDGIGGQMAAAGAKLGVQVGTSAAEGGLAALTSGFKSLASNPILLAAGVAIGVAVGVAAAAAIGAAISAALLLAVGGGVIALGVKQAMDRPEVASAWKTFAERAKKAFAGFGDAFVGPMQRAADRFGGALERIAPVLKPAADALAPVVDTMSGALADMLERIAPSLANAAEKSKPLFDVLAAHAPKIGDSIAKFFDSIAKSGPGASLFLDHVLSFFEKAIENIGTIIFWLSTLYVVITMKVTAAWEGMKNIASSAWNAVKDGAKAAWTWITDRVNQFVGFVTGLPGRIRSAVGGLFDGIKDAFRNAVNWIIDKWNNLSFSLPSVDIPGLGRIGGGRLDTPDIPRLAAGGRARPGRAYLVGENGPELWSPDSLGTMTPNHALGPGVLELHLDLGHDIQRVVTINLRDHDRSLRSRAMAGAGRRR